MKKLLILLLMVSLSLQLVAAAEVPELTASIQSYSPVPAEPGIYITANIRVVNNGEGDAKLAALEVVDNYPFTIDDQSFVKIGALGSGEDYLAEFRVRIDGQALDGTNYLKVRYTSEENSAPWFEKELPITIQATQKTVSINKVEVDPEIVAPGDQSEVTIKVKNLGGNDLRDIAVKLDLSPQLLGTTTIDLPFAPIGSSVEKRIAFLGGGQTADFNFVLQTYPTAPAAIYKIPVVLSYTDEEGTESTVDDLISLIVNGESDILVQIDSSSVYSDSSNGEIVFTVTNRGFDEIKFLTLSLDQNDGYKVLSASNEEYLGNVDSDDYETASFEISLTQEQLTSLTFPVTITFKDALNNEYDSQKELTLPLISSEEAGKGQSSSGGIVVVVIVVLIIAFVIYRKVKKRRKK